VAAFSGVDLTGTNGSGAIGATVSASGGGGNLADGSLTTTHNNSWVFAIGNDSTYCATHTADTGQSVVIEFMDSNCNHYWVQRQSSPIPARRTTVEINDIDPTEGSYNLSIVEIVPIEPKFSLSGKISGPGGNGTTVTLGGGATASTVADASGNYTFTGLLADTYTVTPSLTGYTYTPASTQVTITNANVSNVNFSSTAVPVVQLTPGSLDFGSQLANTASAAKTVTLKNIGQATLQINQIFLDGANVDQFSETHTCGTTLAAGSSCTFSVVFAPNDRGAFTAVITLATNDAGSPDYIGLSGTGIAAVASFSPTSLSFGNQLVNTSSTALGVTLSNTGDVSMSIAGISIAGTNPGDFGQTNTCGTSLAVGARCTISVKFTPTVTGTRSATLSIADNALGNPHTISLSGIGTTPIASVSPTSVNFGIQAVNTSSSASSVTLRNTGTATMTINSTSIGGANASDFSRTTTCGSSLSVNASCTISVTFKPTAAGSRAATLSIADNAAGSPQTVALSGTGTFVTVTPASLTFANQNVGTTSTAQTITMRNVGTTTVTGVSIGLSGTNASDFARTTTCGATLAAGVSCTISVTFTPTDIGTRTASITVGDSDPAGQQQTSLTGTGTSPIASVSPTSLTFAVQAVNTSSSASVVTLRNTGTGAMTISSTTFTGTNAGDFSRTTTCGATLAAGGSCTISVTFRPTAAGARTATLSIADNAAGNPHTVPLSGTATGVTLTPTSLTFTSRSVGTTSAAQVITLRNVGTTTLTGITSALNGTNPADYARTTTCGATLAAGVSCTISVTFTPTASGTRTATLAVTDSDLTSPQQVSLTGTGV
jgi:hypothetical protein